jgi:FAD/FMN-containing dehydrogenase
MCSANTVDLYEAVSQPQRVRKPRARRTTVQPCSADEIATVLSNSTEYPSPVRPVGSGSSITRCSQTATGTRVDMTALDRILSTSADTVTVQAGVRLRDLAEYLAEDGMELVGTCADPNRTVGGAISSGALAPNLPGAGSEFASSVCQISLINGIGRRVDVGENLPDLLTLVRMSYGLLGIVYSAKLRVRPICPYIIRHNKFDFAEFVRIIPNLMQANAAVRASLMPFRDRVYVELRYPDDADRQSAALPWKLRDWAANSAVPRVVRSVAKIVPVKQLRDPLIDGLTEATHVFFNSRLGNRGSNAAEQTGRFRKLVLDGESVSCTWLFPLREYVTAVQAYRKFCQQHYKNFRFRCDLPAESWRVDKDQRALLSPSFDGPAFALSMRSTSAEGWDDFLLEFAEFAAHYKGIPVFNQTKGIKPHYAASVYGQRLDRFRDIRTRLDPQDRLLNQFFAEHIG